MGVSFTQALEWMKEGKEVRRRKFDADLYCIEKHGFIYFYGDFGCTNGNLSIEDIEADDWELYEEEDNWNWSYNASYNLGVFKSVQTLKEKIIRDLDKGEDVRDTLDKRFGF